MDKDKDISGNDQNVLGHHAQPWVYPLPYARLSHRQARLASNVRNPRLAQTSLPSRGPYHILENKTQKKKKKKKKN